MEIRRIKEDEQEKVIFTLSQAFYYDCENEYKLVEKGKFRYEDFLGAFDDSGKMLAVLQCEPQYMWLNGRSVESGGIANVASLPECRRGGIVRKLIETACSNMYDDGYVMSFLFPFSYPYYRKFGYELCNELQRFEASPEDLTYLPYNGTAKQFEPGENGTDPGEIIDIYTAFSQKYNIMLDRDSWQWEKNLEHDPVHSAIRTYIVYDEQKVARAYFTYIYKREATGSDLTIKDLAWKDTEGMYMLFGFLGRFAGNVKKIKFHIPPDVMVSYLWQEPKKYEIFGQSSGMARVINAKAALETVGLLQGESFTIKIDDPFMEQNNKSYKVYFDGEIQAREYDGECDIECSVHALAQLVTGFAGLETAQSRSDVKIAANKETLLKAFPKKMVYIADFF